MIQLISLRFNYKAKSPSYPSPLDRGSRLPNKLPPVSQESLNYSFYFSFLPLSPMSSPSPPSGLISLFPLFSHMFVIFLFLFSNATRMGNNYLHHWFPIFFGLRLKPSNAFSWCPMTGFMWLEAATLQYFKRKMQWFWMVIMFLLCLNLVIISHTKIDFDLHSWPNWVRFPFILWWHRSHNTLHQFCFIIPIDSCRDVFYFSKPVIS